MRVRHSGIAAAIIAAFTTATAASAQIVVGTGTDGNCIPFTCNLSVGSFYQEIYAAGAFTGSGFITEIDFFRNQTGMLNTMSFTLSLSTTTKGLNVNGIGGISTTTPNANDGADNTLFGTYSIGGAAPAILSFLGTPYFYDPSAGNLLLDLRVTSLTPAPSGTLAFYNANSGDAANLSRADDFSSAGFTGYGLVTQFNLDQKGQGLSVITPEPATLGLLATGFAGLVGFRRRRR